MSALQKTLLEKRKCKQGENVHNIKTGHFTERTHSLSFYLYELLEWTNADQWFPGTREVQRNKGAWGKF